MSRRSRSGRKRRIKVPNPLKRGIIRATQVPEVELSDKWRQVKGMPGYQSTARPKILKLCADHNVPIELVEGLRQAGIPVETAIDVGLESADDYRIVSWARRKRRLLLSFNHRDFWNDKKHQIQKSPGIIAVAVPANELGEAALALDIFYSSIAKNVTLDWWKETKIRVTKEKYRMKKLVSERIKYSTFRSIGDRLFYKNS